MDSGCIHPDEGPISLDTTLAELYARDSENIDYVFVPLFLSSRIKLSSAVSKPEKYLYYDDIVNQNPQSDDEVERLRRDYSIKYFALIVQRFAFAAGNMQVLVVDPEVSGAQSAAEMTERQEAEKTLNVLAPKQKPQLITSNNLKAWEMQNPDQKLAVTFPLCDLDRHPHVVDPEVHYELLSKRGLAKSGLKTPACKIIDFQLPTPTGAVCCAKCQTPRSADSALPLCADARDAWLASESAKVAQQVLAHPLPFVLKLQQTVSGAGTFILTTPAQRAEAATHIGGAVMSFLLARMTPLNAHLHPSSVLLSDMVADIRETLSVTFFVTRAGASVFLCCSRQQMSGGNQWIGSTIDYRAQAALEARTAATTRATAAFLHRAGYIGPVGMDILEDGEGAQWVVDLNVRTPSSLLLGPLKGHFMARRLWLACLITKELGMGREAFMRLFEEQLRKGSLVIVAWFEESDGRSSASLVLAAPDEDGLSDFAEEVGRYVV